MKSARMLRRFSLSRCSYSQRSGSLLPSVPRLWSQESPVCSRKLASTLCPSNQLRSFAASTSTDDAPSLAEAIQQEIEYERSTEGTDHEMDASIPQPPDKAWTLAEKDGSSEIVLTRQYKGEQITVTANINPDMKDFPTLPKGLSDLEDEEEPESTGGQMEEPLEGEPDDDLLGPPLQIPFDVTIKKGGDSLRVRASFDGGYIDIRHFGHGKEGKDLYDGPDFTSLDPNLQQAVGSHLEERGIDTTFAEYLMAAHEAKEHKEYIAWLSRIQKFVS